MRATKIEPLVADFMRRRRSRWDWENRESVESECADVASSLANFLRRRGVSLRRLRLYSTAAGFDWHVALGTPETVFDLTIRQFPRLDREPLIYPSERFAKLYEETKVLAGTAAVML